MTPAARRPEALLVLARHPARGRVKTRLAREIGDLAALAVYRRMLGWTISLARAEARRGRRVAIWVDPPGRIPAFRRGHARGLACVPQPRGDLGARLRAAFRGAFRSGALRAVAIGTDCPALRRRHLDEAFRRLRGTDAVLGPAADGGYYLLGLARPVPGLFDRIAWGGPRVLRQTLGRLRLAGIRAWVLPALRDVDEARDMEACESLRKEVPA